MVTLEPIPKNHSLSSWNQQINKTKEEEIIVSLSGSNKDEKQMEAQVKNNSKCNKPERHKRN